MIDTIPNLSLHIAMLAENQGVDPTLLWDDANECPQGHSAWQWGERMFWQGDLCQECAGTYYVTEKDEHDLTWHPEWRIGRKPKALTDLTTLMRVVDAWRMLDGMERDVTIITNFYDSGFDHQYSACFMLGVAGQRVYPTRKASLVGEAAALAFLAVLMGEEDPRWQCDEVDGDDEKEGLS